MRGLAEHMAVYSAYHRHPANRAVHFAGIPAIVWSVMVALGRVPVTEAGGLAITAAHLAVVALLAWYLWLDVGLGVACTLVFTVMLVAALEFGQASPTTALWVAGALFVLGWAVQFIGHGVWEKRRPAVFDNVLQAFVAPVFLVAEVAFMLGLRKDLRTQVGDRMPAHLPT